MKRIICFLMVVINLFLCGCADSVEKREENDNKKLEPLYTRDAFYDYIDAYLDGQVPPGHQLMPMIKSTSQYVRPLSQWSSDPFEDFLSPYVTDVVKAKFVSKAIISNCRVCEFEVTEHLRGEPIGRELYVVEANFNLGWLSSYAEYEEGQEYLLLLRKERNVLVQDYLFEPVTTAFIPMASDGNINIDKAKFHSDEPLIDYIYDNELKEAIKQGTFVEKVLEYVADNPYETEVNFIDSEDPAEIVKSSPIILEITVMKDKDDNFDFYGDAYQCRIDRIIKGEELLDMAIIDIMYDDDSELIGNGTAIALPSYVVREGDQYVLALERLASGRLYLSSQYSIFEVSQLERIQKVLGNNE